MKKIIFLLFSLFMLVGNVSAESKVTSFYTVTNKCAVVKDNKAVIPVIVRLDNDKMKFSSFMEQMRIGYVTNYEYVIDLNIYGVSKDNIDVYVDYKRNSVGESLVYFDVSEDMELNRHDELVSFNIGVDIISDTTVTKMNVFDNEVILADDKTCEILNGFKVTEVEKIKYVDLSEIDHKEYFKDLFSKILIGILSLGLIVCIILLIKKKK